MLGAKPTVPTSIAALILSCLFFGFLSPAAGQSYAPHPNTAWLFSRWSASEEGMKVYAQGAGTHPIPRSSRLKKSAQRRFISSAPTR
jgi:ABC-type Fe3+ transport system substrate-binding protein